ncbi:hypothetical protein [Pseudoalteromonas luteoviolacea]|uniref:Peptidase M60 domain-containing protein n=1 Tax=Pseudoalteromonas luteoviolacea S4060-1 TaxID=1365257 RepID=A0A162B780_9GAMM|nr:hypothetical protein [Pseudoalteromonas luteoviolacea]KZN67599.1 hypothetical protein N478_02250 [Pseudoalteromonas luteoviolacea S4060-1]
MTSATKSESSIKSPTQMQVDIDVSGRVSTLNHIDIQFVGKQIPRTYSDGKISNSRGYNWWVSKHFALKSDLPEEKVYLYLELLEMSYPHYVELFGMEPSNIDNQRIAVVYGSSRDRVREAMLDDGFLRGVHTHAGGETMFYNRAGYSFPSHRQHHQRYIVIHETMHAFHMALNGHSTWAPNWITEGMADAIASHTYDPTLKQLNVMVFDRAPMNYLALGLEQYHNANQPSFEQINDDPRLKRGLNFFIVHFLLSDPTRYHYFKRYLRTLMDANPDSEHTLPTANKLLKATFPDWQALETQFAQFIQSAQPSFYIVKGPWEQNGAGYFLRSDKSDVLHRLDILANNNSKQITLDFPAPLAHPLIAPVKQDSLGALIDFEPEQRTRGKLGLGLITELSTDSKQKRLGLIEEADFSQDKMLAILIENGNKLSLQFVGYNLPKQFISLPTEITEDIALHHQLAVNLRQQGHTLSATLNTKDHSHHVEFALPEQISANVDLQKLSVLGNAMNHTITPYIFGHSKKVKRLSSASPNPWQYQDAALALRAFNTCESYVSQLQGCRSQLSTAFDKLTVPSQHEALSIQLSSLLNTWQRQLDAPDATTLSGITIFPRYDAQTPFLQVVNPSKHAAKLTLTHSGISESQTIVPGQNRIELSKKATQYTYQLHWQGTDQQGAIDIKPHRFDGVYLNAALQKQQLEIALSGPYSGATTGQLDVKFLPYATPISTPVLWQDKVEIAPYESRTWQPKLPNVTQLAHGILEVTATLDVDGEPILLKQQIKL